MAMLLKGAEVAKALTEGLHAKTEELKKNGVEPCLAILRVGAREDDLAYERGALKRCEKVGVAVRQVVLPEDVTQKVLMENIHALNADEKVHGVLMFRPLPGHLDDEAARAALDPKKDMDGITDGSMTAVYAGTKGGYPPCTAAACVALLKHYNIPIKGKRVVVIGRSLVIGKPVSLLLLAEHATVTICHSRSENLPEICREADILVVAAGKAGMVGAESVRAGQVVLDVGIHVGADGNLCGDTRFAEVEPVVEAIPPVPGGVGTVTSTILASHVVEAAERAGFAKIKLNCVLLGGVNDDEIADFVDLTREHPWQVRFIERMPMGCGKDFGTYLPSQAVLDRCPELEAVSHDGVAACYRLPDAKGTVGLIAPMSHAFCAECSRIRITADGKLKPCLHSDAEITLRGLSGEELEQAIRRGILMKPERHHMDETGVTETHRGMFAIGG